MPQLSGLAAAYLDAIGLSASIAQDDLTLELLNAIYRAHTTVLPFSTVHVLLDEPLSLLSSELLEKRSRGALCFEHCRLMREALQSLGFNAHRAAGEVFWAGEWTFPFSHHLNLVDLDGSTYLLDTGFPMKPCSVLKLEDGVVQKADDGKEYIFSKLVPEEGKPQKWLLSVMTPDGPHPLHRFTAEHVDDDHEGVSAATEWLYSDGSPFKAGWMLQIHKPDGTNCSLANGSWAGSGVPPDQVKYVVRPPHGAPEQVRLLPAGSDEVQRLIKEEFKAEGVPQLPAPRAAPPA